MTNTLTVENKYIIGINGGFGGGHQDAAAVLIKNGKVIFAIEEERIIRVKHAPGRMPTNAIKLILKECNLKIEEVSEIAFHGETWYKSIDDKLKSYFFNEFGFVPKICRYHHHEAHAASSYFSSGFKKALIFTFDNSGDGVSTRVSIGEGNKITALKDFKRPNSLGILYSAFTQFCGFNRDADEYKLMGLTAYGNHNNVNLDGLIKIDTETGDYEIDPDFFIEFVKGQPSPNWQEMLFSKKMTNLIGKERNLDKNNILNYKDVAAKIQNSLETIVINLISSFITKYKIKNICLAGGVSLNCLMNQKIMHLENVENLYIPPVGGDMGIALGNAYLASIKQNISVIPFPTPLLGNQFTNDEILEHLELCNLKFQKISNIEETIIDLMLENKIVGVFQDRMEYGPRALGSRSILAKVDSLDISKKINAKIKFRENFRPFGASLLEEDFDDYFIGKPEYSPYMNMVYKVKESKTVQLKAIVHADNTSRLQIVNEKQYPLFYKILKEKKRRTGNSITLNTSFNLSHEPVVFNPQQAIASFYSSGMDALVIGSFLLKKEN